MAILRCAAAPRFFPVRSSFSRRNKEHKLYPSVALTQSTARVSSPISLPQAKAGHVALELIRTISEEDDDEVQDELDRLQNASEILKIFFRDIILVLVASNPILRPLSNGIACNDHFLRWSYFGASYGASLVLSGFVKMYLWKRQVLWWYDIVLGFLIYKANLRNIALYRKGRRPDWLLPLFVLVLLKCIVVFLFPSWMPANIIWVLIDAIASFLMLLCVEGLKHFYSKNVN